MKRSGVKNPDDMRLVIAAVTLWILHFAQNDSYILITAPVYRL